MNLPQQRQGRYQNGTLERIARKNGPDTWTFRWVDHVTGKRRRVQLGSVTELRNLQAVRLAADGYRLQANHKNNHLSQVTMAGLLDRYERECLLPFIDVPVGGVDDRTPSVQCARGYRSLIRVWIRPHWGEHLVAAFNEPHTWLAMEEWLASLWQSARNPDGLAPKTVRGIWSVMKLVFRRAMKWGYLPQNPMLNVDLPAGSTKRRQRPATLSPGQYLELLELFGPMERAALAIAGWLGTRRGEGFGLQWRDLDLEQKKVTFVRGFVNGRITRLKTEASRTEIALPEEVVSALLAWRAIAVYTAPTDWIFASPARRGKRPYWPGQLMKTHIKPKAKAAGFGDIGWHTFRHTFSSWSKQVLKLEETKELLRHQNLATSSELYGGLSFDAKREAQQRVVEWVKASAAAEQARMAAKNQAAAACLQAG